MLAVTLKATFIMSLGVIAPAPLDGVDVVKKVETAPIHYLVEIELGDTDSIIVRWI